MLCCYCGFVVSNLTQAGISGPVLMPTSDQRINGKPLMLAPASENDLLMLLRTHELPVFDKVAEPGENFHAGITDDFRYFPFALNFSADVSISIRPEGQDEFMPFMTQSDLSAGMYFFTLSYADIFETLKQDGAFDIRLSVTFDQQATTATEEVLWRGLLARHYRGEMLGNVIQHDVAIFMGNVTLRRDDISLESLGPGLNFIRNYSGHKKDDGRFAVMGQGWTHNHRIALHIISLGHSSPQNNLPEWVERSKKQIRNIEQLPKKYQTPVYVEVENGGLFQREGDVWKAQRSFHGRLSQRVEGEKSPHFLYQSVDNSHYDFAQVDLKVYRPTVDFTLLTFSPNAEEIDDLSVEKTRIFRLPAYAFTKPQSLWIKSIADKNRNQLRYEYQETSIGPMITSATDASGRQLTFDYTPGLGADLAPANKTPLRLSAVNGPGGLNLSFKYDAEYFNQMTFQRDNFIETYGYIPAPGESHGIKHLRPQVLRRYRDSNKHATTFYFHSPNDLAGLKKNINGLPLNRVVKSVRYPDMLLATFDYIAEQHKRILTNLNGAKTEYILNSFGNPIEEKDPLGHMLTKQWSVDAGQPDTLMTMEVDARRNITSYQYDTQGNLIRTEYPDGSIDLALWDLTFSEPLKKKDANAEIEYFDYDEFGNLLVYTQGEYTVRYAYNTLGQKIQETSGGIEKHFEYDQYGYLAKIINNKQTEAKYTHDIRGRLHSVHWADGSWEKYQYDNLDRILLEQYSDGKIMNKRYDAKGNMIFERLDDGSELHYYYNARDVVVKITFSAESTMYYRYDPIANLTLQVYTNGDIATHRYNAIDEEILPSQFKRWVLRPLR